MMPLGKQLQEATKIGQETLFVVLVLGFSEMENSAECIVLQEALDNDTK